MPLQIGKTPIVVPRQHQFNEHVNDHQVEFARNVAQRMGTIIPVEDIETLGDIITNYDQIVAGMGHGMSSNKSSNYSAALEYLIFKHDEFRKTPILDQNGNRIMRDEFYLDGLNCEPYSFDAACQQLNREYQKNKNKNEVKSHHYIISFDPRDSTENCLTGKRAQELGLEYAKANFPGHQALVCTHMDCADSRRIAAEKANHRRHRDSFNGR